MQKAQSLTAGTEREQAYIAALADFYLPGTQDYPVRIAAYSLAMGRLYAHNPSDVDAGTFYALSLLAAEAPDDTSLAQEHRAMAVLTPLFVKYPDNPGVAGSPPEVSTLVYWERTVAHGHLRQLEQARADLARYDELLAEIRKGKRAYTAEGTFTKIEHAEMLGWVAFAGGKQDEAFTNMRTAADLQDKVGQAEVDIRAREMLADMLLESGHAQQALSEYEIALKLSPNRLNGLYNAGRAAEAAGERSKAQFYFAALMTSKNNGENSTRPELTHARRFLSVAQSAAN